jgi:hypothetical protein
MRVSNPTPPPIARETNVLTTDEKLELISQGLSDLRLYLKWIVFMLFVVMFIGCNQIWTAERKLQQQLEAAHIQHLEFAHPELIRAARAALEVVERSEIH